MDVADKRQLGSPNRLMEKMDKVQLREMTTTERVQEEERGLQEAI